MERTFSITGGLVLDAGLALVAALVLSVSLASCGRAVDHEHSAFIAFDRASIEADELQRRFVVAWQQSRVCESAERLRQLGREQVLPALDAYLSALTAMTPPAGPVASLHSQLIESWRAFRASLLRYYDKVTDANVVRRNAGLEGAWSMLGAHIVDYRRKLSAAFADQGLELAPLSGGPSAPTPER